MKDTRNYPSLAPFFIRMYWEYVTSIPHTPHVLVDVTYPGVQLPLTQAIDGHMVVSLSSSACKYLSMGDDYITFEARFGGVVAQCTIPIQSVVRIFSHEDPTLGLMFQRGEPTAPPEPPAEPTPARARPHLTLVK